MLLTVIVPCYNEEEALHFFYREMEKVIGMMQDVEFELLFVNDGSRDKTLEQVKEMAERDKRVKEGSRYLCGASVCRGGYGVHYGR